MIAQGFKNAQEITKRNAHTFYLTSLFLPKEKRLASYTIYAICRLSDESVDSNDLSLTQKQKKLSAIRGKIDLAFSAEKTEDPLLQAFRQVVEQYQIPREYFDELIEGMFMDLVKSRYQNFEELYLYSYRVAGVIGLIMIKIFGCTETTADSCAVDLGLALQLTNILRDIDEDLARGRIYLPLNEMTQYQIGENDIRTKLVDKKFKDFLVFQIKRARGYFFEASCGIKLIKNARCQFVTFLILELYAKILEKIEKNDFDVYRQRAFVPGHEKLFTLIHLLYRFIKKDLIFRS